VVDQPEGVRSPLLAVAPIGERLRRAVVGIVGEGLKRTCRWERSSFFFKIDLALWAAMADVLSSTDSAFAFFAAFCSAWGFGDAANASKSETRAKDSMDLAFL
jgi:hypothetical protein